ncbi:MAG: GatB/YqeY domain-containing protein [Phycisphaerae bacterium]|nr:GatB/YqeY domain-containing protein [Phycisphaerae bacterium]MDW8262896.1 GatB/YqeY domain-containing protein [Phycisphaerales bacterium]
MIAKLTEEMKSAMKSGQKQRLGVIRMLLNEAKNADLQPSRPTPLAAVEAYARKLRKSIEEYEKVGRQEEAGNLRQELAIVEEFLPRKLSPEETARLVDDFLTKHSFTEKQVGQATGAFLKAHGSTVDPAVASAAIRKKLTGA